MPDQQNQRTTHAVCKKHWQKMRKETLKGLPFLTRPFAGGTVDRMLGDQGFVQSESQACSFCKTNTDVDEVK
jgi:hypothetical protein